MKAMAEMLERLSRTVEVVPLDDERAEMLVAVEGCPTACADLSGFKGKKIVVLSSREAVESFILEPETVRSRLPEAGCR